MAVRINVGLDPHGFARCSFDRVPAAVHFRFNTGYDNPHPAVNSIHPHSFDRNRHPPPRRSGTVRDDTSIFFGTQPFLDDSLHAARFLQPQQVQVHLVHQSGRAYLHCESVVLRHVFGP